jgi:hypothetical protein
VVSTLNLPMDFTYPNTEKRYKTLAPAYIFFMGVGAENIDKKEKESILCILFYIKSSFSFRSTTADQGALVLQK